MDLLLDTLPKLNVDDVFGDNPPPQPMLLALLSQLPNDLHVNLELKAEFLNEAILAIDLDHEIVSYFDCFCLSFIYLPRKRGPYL